MASSQATKCQLCGEKLPDFTAAAAHVGTHEAVTTKESSRTKALWNVTRDKKGNITNVRSGLPVPEQPDEEAE